MKMEGAPEANHIEQVMKYVDRSIGLDEEVDISRVLPVEQGPPREPEDAEEQQPAGHVSRIQGESLKSFLTYFKAATSLSAGL